jgi:hydroxymethylbilane synthase
MLIRIATRESPLAINQALIVAKELQFYHPSIKVKLIKLRTQGDILLSHSLSKIGGKGLFLKEIEQALIDDNADIAVHSMKDVPANQTQNLEINCYMKRGNPRDAFISAKHKSFLSMPKGATIGTSSHRRKGQILSLRPDLKVINIRGNINTRLQKLKDNKVDSIVLAAAGLERNNLKEVINHYFDIDEMLPAIAQGAIGVQNKKNNDKIKKILQPLNHKLTQLTIDSERSFLKSFSGDCSTPIASYCYICGDKLILKSGYFDENGNSQFYTLEEGDIDKGNILGIKSAEKIKKIIFY